MTNTIWALTVGDRVTGEYIGVGFTGVVTGFRSHTMNHRIGLVDVALDAPIDVFAMPRQALHMAVSDDSAALARYLGTDTGDFVRKEVR